MHFSEKLIIFFTSRAWPNHKPLASSRYLSNALCNAIKPRLQIMTVDSYSLCLNGSLCGLLIPRSPPCLLITVCPFLLLIP